MLRTIRRIFGTPPSPTVEDQLLQLSIRLDRVERAETLRAAEHAAQVDQLTRLYKRISARIARETAPGDDPPSTPTESPLSLRERLRKGAAR